jgi:hypothetical protein
MRPLTFTTNGHTFVVHCDSVLDTIDALVWWAAKGLLALTDLFTLSYWLGYYSMKSYEHPNQRPSRPLTQRQH